MFDYEIFDNSYEEENFKKYGVNPLLLSYFMVSVLGNR